MPGPVTDVRPISGQAEVGQPGNAGPLFEQDVGRLDVPVDQPASVGGGQPAGHLRPDPRDRLHRQPPVAGQQLGERLADDVLQDEEWHPIGLVDGVDGDHVVVGQRGHRPRLAQEPLLRLAVPDQVRGQDLDRDLAVEGRVQTLVHHAHAAAADHPTDFDTAQSADEPWPVRRRQGRQGRQRRNRAGRLAGCQARGRLPLQPLDGTRQSGRGSRLPAGGLGQGGSERRHVGEPVQSPAASAAPVQVPLDGPRVGCRHGVGQEPVQDAVGRTRGHSSSSTDRIS